MRIEDVQTIKLLPSWMRDDPTDAALAGITDKAAQQVWRDSRLLTIWNHIDELPEQVLDELAWSLHIEWYETGADIETKRRLIRESDFVHMRKGTVGAVESVIDAYFGTGEIREWWKYGGKPYHFMVYTTNPTLVSANQYRFLDKLRKVKRHSAKLDSIRVGLTGQQEIHVGSGTHVCAIETQQIGDSTIRLRPQSGNLQKVNFTVRMTSNSIV